MGRKCIPENHRKTRLGGRATREKSSLSCGFSQPSGSCWSKVGQAALPLRISPLKVSGRDSLVRLVVNPRPLPAEHPQGSRGPMALASVWTPSQSRCYLASLRPVAPWPAGVPVAVPSTPEPHQLVDRPLLSRAPPRAHGPQSPLGTSPAGQFSSKTTASLPRLALCSCFLSSSLHLISIPLLSKGPGCGLWGLRERALLGHDLIPQLCDSELLVFGVVVSAVSHYKLTYNLLASFHSPEVSFSVCIFQILYLLAINNCVWESCPA